MSSSKSDYRRTYPKTTRLVSDKKESLKQTVSLCLVMAKQRIRVLKNS